jgi:hypothetical protein
VYQSFVSKPAIKPAPDHGSLKDRLIPVYISFMKNLDDAVIET